MPEVAEGREFELLKWMGLLADFLYIDMDIWIRYDDIDQCATVLAPTMDDERGWKKYTFDDFKARIEELTPEHKRVVEAVEALHDYFMIANELDAKAQEA